MRRNFVTSAAVRNSAAQSVRRSRVMGCQAGHFVSRDHSNVCECGAQFNAERGTWSYNATAQEVPALAVEVTDKSSDLFAGHLAHTVTYHSVPTIMGNLYQTAECSCGAEWEYSHERLQWITLANGTPDAAPVETSAPRVEPAEPDPASLARPMSVRLADMLAGDARFTIVSRASGKRFTYRVRRAEMRDGSTAYFVSVLTGSDNEGSYTYAGMLSARGELRTTRASKISQSAPSWQLLAWYLRQVTRADGGNVAQCEVFHAGRCMACGRTLTDPESITRGYGPICAEKF